VGEKDLWRPSKIVKESDVPSKIVNILLVFKGKYVYIFQLEKGLQKFQIVK
jgi:hypothetical protein